MAKVGVLSLIAGIATLMALFLPLYDLSMTIYSASDALSLGLFTYRDLHATYGVYDVTFFPHLLLYPVIICAVGGIIAIYGGVTRKRGWRALGGFFILFFGIACIAFAFLLTVAELTSYTFVETAPNSTFTITPGVAIYVFLVTGIVGVVGAFIPRAGASSSFKVPKRPTVRF